MKQWIDLEIKYEDDLKKFISKYEKHAKYFICIIKAINYKK